MNILRKKNQLPDAAETIKKEATVTSKTLHNEKNNMNDLFC